MASKTILVTEVMQVSAQHVGDSGFDPWPLFSEPLGVTQMLFSATWPSSSTTTLIVSVQHQKGRSWSVETQLDQGSLHRGGDYTQDHRGRANAALQWAPSMQVWKAVGGNVEGGEDYWFRGEQSGTDLAALQ